MIQIDLNNRHFSKELIFLLLLLALNSILAQETCQELAQTVLEKNSLEFVLIPDEGELNTFTTSHIKVNFVWKHIDQMLNHSCVQAYLIEFGPVKYERWKRESVSNNAPNFSPDPRRIEFHGHPEGLL